MAAGALRRYPSPAAAPGVTPRLRTPLRAYAALAGVPMVYPLTVVYWVALVLGRRASAAAFTPPRPVCSCWVTGQAAFLADFKAEIAQKLPWALALIAAATFALLFLMTGSVLIPVRRWS